MTKHLRWAPPRWKVPNASLKNLLATAAPSSPSLTLSGATNVKQLPAWIKRARSQWTNRGVERPSFATPPKPGQESVWDYPRPPRLQADCRHVLVTFNDFTVAETTAAMRVLETASPPTFYIPRQDVCQEVLMPSSATSFCEWKGQARYWHVQHRDRSLQHAGWGYDDPFPEFEPISGYLAFYADTLQCFVDGIRVMPQPGNLYGGWVTPEIVGPFKGTPGTEGW